MKNIILQPLSETFREFLCMPDGVYKNIFFNNNIAGHTSSEASVCYKEDNIYYSHADYKVKKGVKYFLHKTGKQGFTFNTTTKKLSLWYGGSIYKIPYLNKAVTLISKTDWLHDNFWPIMTKSIIEKVLAKKITNPEDLSKHILKLYRIKASPNLFMKGVIKGYMTKNNMLKGIRVAKDFNHYMEFLESQSSASITSTVTDLHIYDDIVRLADTLERKIDYKWSARRVKEEHDNWTKEIMDIEAENIPDVTVESLDRFDGIFPDNWEMLNTQKRVYQEGKTMRHCVYTNYWYKIKNDHYMALHILLGDAHATLGMHLHGDKYTVHQLYGHHNSQVSSEMKEHVDSILKELNKSKKMKKLLRTDDSVPDSLLPY